MLSTIRFKAISKLRQAFHNISDNKNYSYAQCGEDLIIQHLFMVLGITDISYLDIGAHHPTYLSNTYLFYKKGNTGVCIEPDPSLYSEFSKARPRDTHLNCGVGTESSVGNFFVMSSSTLNTFSKEEAERLENSCNQKILNIIKIKLETINEIIQKNFNNYPNLVSIDIEGLDYPILKQFDFNKYRPKVFCVETLSYTEDSSERKITEIIDLMHNNGYVTYADTYINTVFVDKNTWESRH